MALSRSRLTRRMSAHQCYNSSPGTRVAVLYQAIEPPIINGIRKPMKPGGYKDSGADIAYVLRNECALPVVTPQEAPNPQNHEGWCFPDSETGILSAIESGANCLWANTILFANHPLQVSGRLNRFAKKVRIVGQPPMLVEAYDDKNFVNGYLRGQEKFTMPKACIAPDSSELPQVLNTHSFELPIVAKPRRGRGSQGVKVCRSLKDLTLHVDSLGPNNAILEEFLSGVEATVTVMPPSPSKPGYWALPTVVRFNHDDGIAPYNGVVAVTANSRVVSPEEVTQDPAFAKLTKECEDIAQLLKVKAPIRIDVRKRSMEVGSPFVLFDVNMKPNMTAPGRPGREDQASLTGMAAAALGWSPATLLRHILSTASRLDELRKTELPASVTQL